MLHYAHVLGVPMIMYELALILLNIQWCATYDKYLLIRHQYVERLPTASVPP